MLRWLPVAFLLCFAAQPALARETTGAQLERGIALFGNFEDAKAAAVLEDLLARKPPPGQAARARIYLGLIALNGLEAEHARREFGAAVQIDPTVEVPFEASPKARLAFEQARAEVTSGEGRSMHDAHGTFPRRPGLPEEATRAPSAPGPDLLPAFILSGIGLAVLGAGLITGLVANGTLNQAQADQDVGGALSQAKQAGSQGLVADVLMGAGGALLAGGAITFAAELAAGPKAAPAVAGMPAVGKSGFALSF